jgi:hypothetical protein
MTRQTVTGYAPSHWASYLVNGDASDLTTTDRFNADRFARWLGGSIVSCEDAGFMKHHDASQFRVGASDCQEYVAIVESGS